MKKIMVVDDDVEATKLLEAILVHEGYEVVTVNDSTTAIPKARQTFPNMFLLDLMMPGIDGFKLTRLLRDDRNFLFTPIIIITALNDEDSKVVAFGSGADDYLTKPYHPEKLFAMIKEQFKLGSEA